MRVIQYEANEIPWRVADYYMQRKPGSTLARLLRNARTYTTHTQDSGELHPWSTWPTLHRGIYNDTHGIRFINQELPSEWPPIWEILSKAGVNAGVFGSLQSFPIPRDSDYAFYVPDTFAAASDAVPKKYEPFQRLNLRQTKEDGAGAKGLKISKELVQDLVGLLRNGLSAKTAYRLVEQLAKERRNKAYCSRRATLQAPVAFDFFLDAYKNSRPDYCTFFTNHAAGIMHRYWKHSFPQDFGYSLSGKDDEIYRENLEVAMDIVDEQLSVLKDVADRDGAASSRLLEYGQEAIVRPEYAGEFRIIDERAFARRVGFLKPFQMNLAMQPDFSFSFETVSARAEFVEATRRLVTAEGHPLFTYKETDKTVNLNLKPPKRLLDEQVVYFKYDDGEAGVFPIAEVGIDKLRLDEGTGYHQPRGMALFYKEGLPRQDSREVVESIRITPTLLRLFGQCPPSYMADPLSDILECFGLGPEASHVTPAPGRRSAATAS